MRRWLLRIFISLAALIVLVVVIVQIVLWTAVPRNLILGQVQRKPRVAHVDQVGFHRLVSDDRAARSDDVAAAGDESVFDIPRLEVKHTWLPSLLVGRSLQIDALELKDANLVIRENEAGRWNVQEVFELLQRTLGRSKSRPPRAPNQPSCLRSRFVTAPS